jgi:MFS family permease
MNRNLKLVLSTLFLLALGTYIAGTILTPYAESLGASPAVVGLLPSSMYVVRLLFGTPIGRLGDKKGALTVLKYSLLLYPVIGVAYYFSSNIPMLFAARLLHGTASAMMLPMVQAYIGQLCPRGKEGRYMGIYNLVFFIGGGLGSWFSTVIASDLGYRADFISLIILAVIALVIIFLTKKDAGQTPPAVEPNQREKLLPVRALVRNTGILAIAAVKIPLAVIGFMVSFLFIKYPAARGYSVIASGVILAVYNILTGAIQIPFGRLSDKADKFTVIIVSAVLTAIALALLPMTGNIVVILLLMAFIALSTASMMVSSSALSAIVGRDLGMAGTMGFLETVYSLGMIGGFCLGLLMGRFGLGSIFYFCSLVTVLGTAAFAGFWAIYRKKVHIV